MLERKVTAEAVVQQLEQFMTRETFISITGVDIAKASAQDVIVALKNYLMPEMPFSFEYTETEIEKFIDKSKEVNGFSFASKMHIELRKNLSTLMDLDIFHKCCFEIMLDNETNARTLFLNIINNSMLDYDEMVQKIKYIVDECWSSDKKERAISLLKEMTHSDRLNNDAKAAAYLDLGLIYHDLRNFTEAIIQYSNAISFSSGTWQLLRNRAICYKALDDNEMLINDLQNIYDTCTGINLEKKSQLLFTLAEAYNQKGETEKACKLYDEILQLNNLPRGVYKLARSKKAWVGKKMGGFF